MRGSLAMIVVAVFAGPSRGQQKTVAPPDRTNASIRKMLAAKTDIDALNVPFIDFVKGLAKRSGIPIVFGKGALRRAEIDPKLEITASFQGVPLEVALRQFLRPLKLEHRVVNGALLIDDIGDPADDDVAKRAVLIRAQQVVRLRAVGNQIARLQRIGGALRLNGANKGNEHPSAQQLRQLLRLELDFVNSVCALTPEQTKQLQQDGSRQNADVLKNWQVDNGAPLPSYARETIQDEVLAAVRSRLPKDQVDRYESEIRKRKADLHQACARNLVVTLDHELCLTAQQRERLGTELTENWDDAWNVSVILTSTEEQALIPMVPDELIVSHLDALQRLLWKRLAKRGKVIWSLDETAFLGLSSPELNAEN
jgi:hypothetical protein